MSAHPLEPAKPGPGLSLEAMQDIAKRQGGRAFLRQQRTQIQALRDQQAASMKEQLAITDDLLRRFDIAIDGGVRA